MPEVSRLQGVVDIEGAEEAQRKLAGVQTGFEGATDAAQKSSPAFDDAGLSVTDFNSALQIAEQTLKIAGEAYEETIVKAAKWGDEMGDLAQITGNTVEETSRMAVMLDLMGVKSDGLGRVVKAMSKEGLQFNLETLIDLNQQYNAIQDPVERTQFLFKNFGKAGEDMAEVMGRDRQELEALARTADRSGRVIGEEAAARAEQFNVQMNILKEEAEGAKVRIGTLAIELGVNFAQAAEDATAAYLRYVQAITGSDTIVTSLAGGIHSVGGALFNLADATRNAHPPTQDFIRDMDEVEQHMEGVGAAAESTRGLQAWQRRWNAMGASFQPFLTAEEEAKRAMEESQAWLEHFQMGLDGNPIQQENEQYASSMTDLGAKAAELRGEIDKLTESNGKYYETVQGNGATAAELELANQKLAAAYKKLGEETDPLKIAQLNVEIEKQQGFIAGADQVVGGYINNSKKIGELETEYQKVEDAIKDVEEAHRKATAQIILDILTQELMTTEFGDHKEKLSAEEKTILETAAKNWGLYEGSTIEAMQNVDKSLTEHGLNAAAVVSDLNQSLTDLPDTKYIDIMVRTHYQAIHQGDTQIGDEDYGGWDGGGNDNNDGGGSSGGNDNNDNGGDFNGAQSVSDFSQPSAGSLGGLTIQIYETGNPQETANAVIAILQDRGLVDRTLVT